MADYISEIEHALTGLVDAVWAEHREVESLAQQVSQKTAETEDGYRQAEGWLQEEHPDDYMLGVGLHWDTYFGADKDRYSVVEQHREATQKLTVREFSRAAMSGALLQFGKQAISIVHGGLPACPEGRLLGSQPLKAIIWQGRNQGLHWEEGTFRKPVEDCFDLLTNEVDPAFANFRARSVAFEVVSLLGWKSVDAVTTDLRSLA